MLIAGPSDSRYSQRNDNPSSEERKILNELLTQSRNIDLNYKDFNNVPSISIGDFRQVCNIKKLPDVNLVEREDFTLRDWPQRFQKAETLTTRKLSNPFKRLL